MKQLPGLSTVVIPWCLSSLLAQNAGPSLGTGLIGSGPFHFCAPATQTPCCPHHTHPTLPASGPLHAQFPVLEMVVPGSLTLSQLGWHSPTPLAFYPLTMLYFFRELSTTSSIHSSLLTSLKRSKCIKGASFGAPGWLSH